MRGDPSNIGPNSAALFSGTVGLMIPALQPFLLGALVQARVMTDADLGRVATIESLALACACAIAPRLLGPRHGRLVVGLAAGALALINFMTVTFHGVGGIELLRAAAGLLEGVLLSATIVVIIQSFEPERFNALFLGLSTIPQAIGAYLLPVFVLPRFGVDGGYAALGMLALIGVAAAFLLRLPSPGGADGRHPPVRWSAPLGLTLVAVLLQNAAIGGAWNYIERLGSQHQLAASIVGISAAGCLGLQVLGALGTAWVGWRIPFAPVLIVGSLLQAVIIITLGLSGLPSVFVLSTLLFGLLWLSMSAYQTQLLLRLDPGRGAATLLTSITMLGLSLGPALSSLTVSANDVTGAFQLACIVMLMATAVYFAAIVLGRGRLKASHLSPGVVHVS